MRIGFIGLGKMGLPMARRLLGAGHEVIAYNRTRARVDELARSGCKAARSIADAVHADVVITMLSDDPAVEEIILRSGGVRELLPANRVHVSMSTISPSLSRKLARAHSSKQQKYVSATVLGRPEAAEQGKLFVLASGDADSREKLRPVFQVLGQRTLELGDDPGTSNLVKLSCNFLIASVIESLSEAFALVRKAGCIDPEQYLEVLTGTLFSGGVFQVYGRHVLEHDFKPGFRVPLALKDIELGIAAGKEVAAPLPMASLIRDHFITAVARGWAELDWSSLALVSLEAAGLSRDQEKEKPGERLSKRSA